MKKIMSLLLCAALIFCSLSACASGSESSEKESILSGAQNETNYNTTTNKETTAEEETTSADKIDEEKEIFLNPEVEVGARIEAFINTLFCDFKIAFFDNFDDMSEELTQFVFMTGIYKGIVHKYTGKTGEAFTKAMIEENIKAVFGADVISKLDYSYIPADYDEKRDVYIPRAYGASNNALRYVFYEIEEMFSGLRRTQYSVKLSYIDVNGNLSAFDMDGNKLYPPEYISEMEAENREKAIEEFKNELMQNPQHYERTRLYVEVSDDYIHLMNANQDYNMPYGYSVKELSRDGNYKTIEMYAYEDLYISRRITFELPVEWDANNSSVFGIKKDGYDTNKLNVWLVNIESATREDVLNEYNNHKNTSDESDPKPEIIEENIYTTENYEIFYYKLNGISFSEAFYIYVYYLYANSERFCLFGYVFVDEKNEYDDIINRIAESVIFQF